MFRTLALGSLILGTAAADVCDCLNWKQLYADNRVVCGEGQEMQNETGMGYRAAYWVTNLLPRSKEVCQIYESMDNNYCFNYAFPHFYGSTLKKYSKGQWCYVDSKCTKLNGGRKVPDSETIVEWIPKKVMALMGEFLGIQPSLDFYEFVMTNFHTPKPLPRDISVKLCTGSDKLSKDLEPSKLLEIGQAAGVTLEYFTKMAYYTVRDPDNHHAIHPIWQDVRTHIDKGGDLKKLPENVQTAISKKDPFVVDSDATGHHDKSQRIIVGEKVYKLNAECEKKDCIHNKPSYKHMKGHDIAEL